MLLFKSRLKLLCVSSCFSLFLFDSSKVSINESFSTISFLSISISFFKFFISFKFSLLLLLSFNVIFELDFLKSGSLLKFTFEEDFIKFIPDKFVLIEMSLLLMLLLMFFSMKVVVFKLLLLLKSSNKSFFSISHSKPFSLRNSLNFLISTWAIPSFFLSSAMIFCSSS